MLKTESKLLDDFSAGLDKLQENVQGEVSLSGVAAMAKVFYDEAKLNAASHIKSGTLHDAIYRVFVKERSTGKIKVYRISWNRRKAPHGHLIEFGTSRAPAYPFIRPAFDHAPAAIEAGQERMAEKYEEVKGKS